MKGLGIIFLELSVRQLQADVLHLGDAICSATRLFTASSGPSLVSPGSHGPAHWCVMDLQVQ